MSNYNDLPNFQGVVPERDQDYYGNWNIPHPINHTLLRNEFGYDCIVFSGNIGQTDERRTMRDIFPNGFFNPNHYDHFHGVEMRRDEMIDVWGLNQGRLFAITMVGDIYISQVISRCFNTCTYDVEFEITKNNSQWSQTMQSIIDFSSRSRIHNYDDFVNWYQHQQ